MTQCWLEKTKTKGRPSDTNNHAANGRRLNEGIHQIKREWSRSEEAIINQLIHERIFVLKRLS
jgi:molecular chaperone DnaK (HSP70)